MSQLNGVSSCGNTLLLQKQLREEWNSDAIVQTDCCDSVQTMKGAISPRTRKPIANYTEAFGNAVNAGLGTYYGFVLLTFFQGVQPTELISRV
jgi:beta-glucosidase-like glycosyl hydrolase